ncbi:extensin [Drosophila obscura]|uniref:extensin n=1 Tax=Drosophila obscura TaxID=7282 RepID=UPI001BB2B82A|nr:extensin [Drosophila obscura]
MRLYWNFLAVAMLLLVATASGLRPARSFYRRSYYSALAPGSGQGSGSVPGPIRLAPSGYLRSDLQTNESKRRDVTKKYPKKSHYRPYGSEEDDYSGERYNSAEYSGESSVQDSREYTIGTQIRVQHPITVPKKAAPISSYAKQPKYVTAIPYKSGGGYPSEGHVGSGEDVSPPKRSKWTPVQYEPEPDPFHLVPPPKGTASYSSNSYRVFEPDHDDYEVVPVPVPQPKNHDRYKNVASKKQIEAYIEDQQKLLDDAIKLQLLSNPKLQKFLKAQAHEHEQESRPDLDIEDFESYPPPNFSGPGPLRSKYVEHPPPPPPKGTRSRRRPPSGDLKRAPNSKPFNKPKRKYRSTALVINV